MTPEEQSSLGLRELIVGHPSSLFTDRTCHLPISIRKTNFKNLHTKYYARTSKNMSLLKPRADYTKQVKRKFTTSQKVAFTVLKGDNNNIDIWIDGKQVSYRQDKQAMEKIKEVILKRINTFFEEAGLNKEPLDYLYEQDRRILIDKRIEKATPSTEPLDPLYEQDRHIKF